MNERFVMEEDYFEGCLDNGDYLMEWTFLYSDGAIETVRQWVRK